MAEKRCYTVKELQEILGVNRSTIYNLLKKNEFRWMAVSTVFPKRALMTGWISCRNLPTNLPFR